MSFGSDNPELVEKFTIKYLPEPWKTRVIEEEIQLTDIPDRILFKAMDEGMADYQATLIDAAVMRLKEERLGRDLKKSIRKFSKSMNDLNQICPNPFIPTDDE